MPLRIGFGFEYYVYVKDKQDTSLIEPSFGSDTRYQQGMSFE
jgi:hypothetical protein